MYDDQNFDDYSDYTDQGSRNQLASLANSAFVKGLISVILAEIPIGSIVAIFLGIMAGKSAKEAEAMASRMNCSAGGKCKAGKILGMIGKILGIVMSCFWVFYLVFFVIYFIFIIGLAASGY